MIRDRVMTGFRGNVRNEIPAQGRDATVEAVASCTLTAGEQAFGGESEAAADRCDRTGAALAA